MKAAVHGLYYGNYIFIYIYYITKRIDRRTGSVPSSGIWFGFCWHLIFLTPTGQIQTPPYIRVPWILSPKRCLLGDHRSCSLNEVMEDPVTKTQSCFYLLMRSALMQAANFKWHERVDVAKKLCSWCAIADLDSQWNMYEVNGYWSLAENCFSMLFQYLDGCRGAKSLNGADSGWSTEEDQ